MKISTVSEMRELDRKAIENYGIPEELLMENAGDALYFAIMQQEAICGRRFVVFCGLGNNGGDGFVVARKLHSNGGFVKVFVLGDMNKYKGAAKLNLDILKRTPVEIESIDSVKTVRRDIHKCHVIIDAILGTGLIREVKGFFRDIIEAINESRKIVFSADIPSGVSGDTGKVMGSAVKAHVTVTFGLPKLGNLLYPGYALNGKLYVTHISFPHQLHDSEDLKVQILPQITIPNRYEDAHKGNIGQALFIAGASGYFGAPYFSAYAFLKAGGGYSRLAAPVSITPFVAVRGSEIVLLPQAETLEGSISLENRDVLLEMAEKMDMVIVGPGLSLNHETQKLVRELVRNIPVPLLLDGDGITAICEKPEILRDRKAKTVLTPHLGEMARLTGKTVQDIETSRIQILQHTCDALETTIVLKGAHSLIGFPDQNVFMNMSGNPGMATAGSGDVLAGTIAAMLGLGLNFKEAVLKGVFIHGFAGDLAAKQKGADGITALDILNGLPRALKEERENNSGQVMDFYAGPKII